MNSRTQPMIYRSLVALFSSALLFLSACEKSDQAVVIEKYLSFEKCIRSQNFGKALRHIDSKGQSAIANLAHDLSTKAEFSFDRPSYYLIIKRIEKDIEDGNVILPIEDAEILRALTALNQTYGDVDWHWQVVFMEDNPSRASLFPATMPELRLEMIEENGEWRVCFESFMSLLDLILNEVAELRGISMHALIAEMVEY